MTTQNNETAFAIDYTSRDYYSIRQQLIDRIKSNINSPSSPIQWSGTDPSDFGVALVEAFAYMGDIINYYVDRVANETYILTASQRRSVMNIAKSYGYIPSGYRPATVDLKFTNTGSSTVTIPQGSQVSGELVDGNNITTIVFTTDTDVTIAGNSNQTITGTQGRMANLEIGNDPIYGEQLGISDGNSGQVFKLGTSPVVTSTIQVFVEVGTTGSYTEWTQVVHTADYGPTDTVYAVDTDENDNVYILFGDGISGAVPVNGAVLKANYLIGGGAVGNITTSQINTIKAVPGLTANQVTALNSYMQVTNTSVGVDGADPESTDSIRYNAPFALTALNRAVSIGDYSSLSLKAPNVGKANAIAEDRNSVTIYASPTQSSTTTDFYPGYTGDPSSGGTLTSGWYEMQGNIQDYLADKAMVGVTVTVSPPTYTNVHAYIQYTTLPQYNSTKVGKAILSSLINGYSYQNTSFGQIITPEELEFNLRQVEGVYTVKLISLYRTGDSGRNILIGNPDEVFTFSQSNTTVAAASTDATLTTLTSSNGTFSPSFTSGFYSYNLALTNGTSSITLTPTKSTASHITVNGVTVASGSASGSITTAVGKTTITIVVTAQDGFTVKTYKVIATRAA